MVGKGGLEIENLRNVPTCWLEIKEAGQLEGTGLEGDSTRGAFSRRAGSRHFGPRQLFRVPLKRGWLGKSSSHSCVKDFQGQATTASVPHSSSADAVSRIQRYPGNCIPASAERLGIQVRPNTLHRHCAAWQHGEVSRFRRASTNGTMNCISRKRTPQPPPSPISRFSHVDPTNS